MWLFLVDAILWSVRVDLVVLDCWCLKLFPHIVKVRYVVVTMMGGRTDLNPLTPTVAIWVQL